MHHLQRYRKTLGADLLAGVTGAIAGAPQVMGFALIAGVSPIYGLYSGFIATAVGALAGSTAFMTVVPTNALALVVASTLGAVGPENPVERMFTLTLLVGVFMLMFGVLRLGSLTRFVSNAVMTGFITGAGTLILLGQLRNLTGYDGPRESDILSRVIAWATHPERSDIETLLTGLLAIGVIYLLRKTRFKAAATLVAIVVTSGLVALLGWDSVRTVGDISTIPSGWPPFTLPDLTYAPELVTAALAMAVLASVQSAAVVKAIPQPDGSRASINRQFAGEGIANLVVSVFQGMPVGGSLSRTAVNISAGARSRMANFFAGLLLGLTLLFLGEVIARVTMPALAAILIVAALSLIRPDELRLVWNVSLTGRVSMVATLVATLVLPLQYSIYTGVALSLGLYVYTSSQNIKVRRLVITENGRVREVDLPEYLPDGEPVIISESGNLYFASVRRLEALMPDPGNSKRPMVILRLRDNEYLGSTGIRFLIDYDRKLRSRGGKLLLAGVSPTVRAQLERTGAIWKLGENSVFDEQDFIFAATRRAIQHAEELLKQPPESAGSS